MTPTARGSILAFLVVITSVTAAAALDSPAKQTAYGINEAFDLTRIPFSRYGSYLSFQQLVSTGKPDSLEGLFLRTVHGNVPQQELLRLVVTDGHKDIPFQVVATPTLLTLKVATGDVEIFLPTAERIRIRLHGVGLRLDRPGGTAASANSYATWAEPVDAVDNITRSWDYTASPQDLTLRLSSMQGSLQVENAWNGEASDKVSFTFLPDQQAVGEASIQEFSGSFHDRSTSQENIPRYIEEAKRTIAPTFDKPDGEQKPGNTGSPAFDVELASLRSSYMQWISEMPQVPQNMQATANLAAYLSWSSVVAPQGFLTRPTMLMSKASMTAVWSWDHCFNAMALASAHPEMAWDQFMWVFDSENADGISPDLMTDRWLLWSFSKPPIHGLAMAYLEKENPGFFRDTRRLAELYPKLARRTEWYFRFRDWDHDGLPQYNHGNDSGWDNSTIFSVLPPVEAPDLAAFLVLQMQELANIAATINRPSESKQWSERAEHLRGLLLERMWRDNRFVALHEADHRVIDADSLLLYMPIVLGTQLPSDVRQPLIDRLKQPGHFLTDYGIATEPLTSSYFVEDGYWRGAIWAPSTFLLVQGLEADGDHAFADELRTRFCKLVMKSGFAENFGARSGAPQRDQAYTWTSSVFLIFAHDLYTATQDHSRQLPLDNP